MFIEGGDPRALKARISFAAPLGEFGTQATAADRRYALREVQQRLHQAPFREAVLNAHHGRCALSGLPEPMLLGAAHIIGGKEAEFGQPLVPNGIPLANIHHAAFDAHLIGIDPDHRIHVADRLLAKKDGPMLEALRRLNGGSLILPRRNQDNPDRDRLALRFERLREAA